MRRSLIWSLPVAFGVLLALPLSAAAQEMPEGVTAEMVETGQQLFGGEAACATCHGQTGEGTPIGPNLTDEEWLHIDGSYDAIIELVNEGVAEPAEAMTPMAPRGGSSIDDEQLRAVAAYVWSLSSGG